MPSGAATSANQPALNGDGGALAHVTNFPATQAISASALPLPTNAATDAHLTNVQSAPGSSQTVAVTVQGNASGIAVPVSAASLPLPLTTGSAALRIPAISIGSSSKSTTVRR